MGFLLRLDIGTPGLQADTDRCTEAIPPVGLDHNLKRADPQRDIGRQRPELVDDVARDRDEPGGADRLHMPRFPSSAEETLDLRQVGIGEPDLAEGTPADTDRRARELHDTGRVASAALDLEIRGVGHSWIIPLRFDTDPSWTSSSPLDE